MKIETIVVPTDLSDESSEALRVAARWASTTGAAIHLMYAAEDPVTLPGPEYVLLGDRYGAIVEDAARDDLARLAATVQGADVHPVVRHGRAAGEIVALATELKADLIVMATHGRSGLRRAMLGSVTEAVVRTASCPVASVHAQVAALPPVATVSCSNAPTL